MHPNSLANLKPNRNGSQPRYGEQKKRRHITVTDTAWDVVKENLKKEHKLSVSEAVELLGRGKFKLVEID